MSESEVDTQSAEAWRSGVRQGHIVTLAEMQLACEYLSPGSLEELCFDRHFRWLKDLDRSDPLISDGFFFVQWKYDRSYIGHAQGLSDPPTPGDIVNVGRMACESCVLAQGWDNFSQRGFTESEPIFITRSRDIAENLAFLLLWMRLFGSTSVDWLLRQYNSLNIFHESGGPSEMTIRKVALDMAWAKQEWNPIWHPSGTGLRSFWFPRQEVLNRWNRGSLAVDRRPIYTPLVAGSPEPFEEWGLQSSAVDDRPSHTEAVAGSPEEFDWLSSAVDDRPFDTLQDRDGDNEPTTVDTDKRKTRPIDIVCPICLEVDENMEYEQLIKCNHVFHNVCLQEWAQTLPDPDDVGIPNTACCPTCRTPMA